MVTLQFDPCKERWLLVYLHRENFDKEVKTAFKINIFIWYLQKRVVLTKDNLDRRQIEGKYKVLFL